MHCTYSPFEGHNLKSVSFMPFSLTKEAKSCSPALEFGLIFVIHLGLQNQVKVTIFHYGPGYRKPVCSHLLPDSSTFPGRRCLCHPSRGQGRHGAEPGSPGRPAKATQDLLTPQQVPSWHGTSHPCPIWMDAIDSGSSRPTDINREIYLMYIK